MDEFTSSKQAVITDGLAFMRSLADHYGPEYGQKIFDSVCDAVDAEIKGAILFALISGQAYDTVLLETIPNNTNTNFINCIKAVRNVTGFSLKETKDLCDMVRNQGIPQRIKCNDPSLRSILISELRANGCIVR